jgi:hypothetical protein
LSSLLSLIKKNALWKQININTGKNKKNDKNPKPPDKIESKINPKSILGLLDSITIPDKKNGKNPDKNHKIINSISFTLYSSLTC